MVTPGITPRPARGMRWLAVGQIALWSAIGLGAFLLLAESVQNSAEFGRLQLWILLVDACGVVALSVLLARRLWRLVRDYRAHVPGSRLTARTVGIFGALVIAPLLIVYMSSLEFINQGIDSWFKVEVKEGLNDALGLSRAALDLRMREYSERTVALADTLAATDAASVQGKLDAERRAS
jgi:nitrogen fixation/metabolism regulation signal transduction histidine kinase